MQRSSPDATTFVSPPTAAHQRAPATGISAGPFATGFLKAAQSRWAGESLVCLSVFNGGRGALSGSVNSHRRGKCAPPSLVGREPLATEVMKGERKLWSAAIPRSSVPLRGGPQGPSVRIRRDPSSSLPLRCCWWIPEDRGCSPPILRARRPRGSASCSTSGRVSSLGPTDTQRRAGRAPSGDGGGGGRSRSWTTESEARQRRACEVRDYSHFSPAGGGPLHPGDD